MAAMQPALSMSNEGASDVSLAAQAAQGDHEAFAQIMRRYNRRLYRLAVSVIGDASEAEDVLQESYVRAFHALGGYGARGSLGAWLARIVRNEAIDRVRARDSRQSRVALRADLEDQGGEDDMNGQQEHDWTDDAQRDPQTITELAQLEQLLERAIERLPAMFRSVFVLREVEGLSVEETAEYLGIPLGTVKTRDYRARKLLRSSLSTQIEGTLPQTFSFLGARCDALVTRVLLRLQQR